MIDINLIREQAELVRTALRNRQNNPDVVDEVLNLDVRRRSLLTEVEALKAKRNAVSKEISRTKDQAERQEKCDHRVKHPRNLKPGARHDKQPHPDALPQDHASR